MIPPNVEDIDRIARLNDPILRNLQITQCYHELSECLAERNGFCANWCTFATWASRQAGQTIRREDLIRAFEERFFLSPEISATLEDISAKLVQLGVRLQAGFSAKEILQAFNPAAAFARASDAVARGNKKVFEEIGFHFARFLQFFASETASIVTRQRASVPRFVPESRRTDSSCCAKPSRHIPRRHFRTASRNPS